MIKTVWCITSYVLDLTRAKNFYEEVLGLEKKYEFSSYVGFECDRAEIGLIPKAEGGKVIVDSSPSVVAEWFDWMEVHGERIPRQGFRAVGC